MIVYSLIIITLLIAFTSLLILVRSGKFAWSNSWPALLLSLSLAVFIYLFGVWVFLSVYLKYVFITIYFIVWLLVLINKKKVTGTQPPQRANIILTLTSAAIFYLLSILYFTGTAGKPYSIINLTLPFKKGTYFVFQGGKGLPTNFFHFTGQRTAFAMDIIKLNKIGNRANCIFSSTLVDYEIFGDTIYSPCAGTVIKTENDNPDNIPPLRKRGPTNINQVLIETGNAYIFLGHLKQGSLLVKAGDEVRAGAPLGLSGNSGMSLEPHLHIQAHAKTGNGAPWYRQPQLLIQFDGKSYLLFEEINAGK